MYKLWTWNGWETRAATYAAARRNIQFKAFGRRWCPQRDMVDPQEVGECCNYFKAIKE